VIVRNDLSADADAARKTTVAGARPTSIQAVNDHLAEILLRYLGLNRTLLPVPAVELSALDDGEGARRKHRPAKNASAIVVVVAVVSNRVESFD